MTFSRRSAFFLLSLLLIVVLIGEYYFENSNKNISEEPINAETICQTAYTLRTYEGYIALFLDSESTPEAIYSVAVASLPEIDRETLADGITVTDISQLQRLLEDFMG